MELAILMGLQGAGKTTFYHARLAATHVHVSKDLMPNNRRPQRRQEQLVEAALGEGRSVAVDNTNPSLASRASLIALGRAHSAELVGYYFEPVLKESLERKPSARGPHPRPRPRYLCHAQGARPALLRRRLRPPVPRTYAARRRVRLRAMARRSRRL